MYLTDREIKFITDIPYYNAFNIKLTYGSFYVKRLRNNYGNYSECNEIIGYKIANFFNLVCPKYYLIEYNKQKFLLSYDLQSIGDFKTFAEYGIDDIDSDYLLNIFAYIDKLYNSNEAYNLKKELIKMFTYDMLLMNADRNFNNWGIIDLDMKPHIAIFDHEFILGGSNEMLMTSYVKKDSLEEDTMQKNLEYFLSHYSLDYIDIFLDYFKSLNPNTFTTLLNEIEEENIIIKDNEQYDFTIKKKNAIIRLYRNNYEILKRVIRGINYGRGEILKRKRDK